MSYAAAIFKNGGNMAFYAEKIAAADMESSTWTANASAKANATKSLAAKAMANAMAKQQRTQWGRRTR